MGPSQKGEADCGSLGRAGPGARRRRRGCAEAALTLERLASPSGKPRARLSVLGAGLSDAILCPAEPGRQRGGGRTDHSHRHPPTGGLPECPPSAPAPRVPTPPPRTWGPQRLSLSPLHGAPRFRLVLTRLSLWLRTQHIFHVVPRCVLLSGIPAPVLRFHGIFKPLLREVSAYSG